MKIYSALQIGAFHTNFCEDFLIQADAGNQQALIAVMDGCSMGTESVFASILYGKILRKIALELYYTGQNRSEKESLKYILQQLLSQTRKTQNELNLEVKELLSTLVIGVVNRESLNAELLVIGDGLVCIDGKVMEFEQNDRPDYLGYHLSENFEEWYSKQNQFVSATGFKDLSICTDGIYTFKDFIGPQKQMSEKEIVNYLLVDTKDKDTDRFLTEKIRQLKEDFGHTVTDDLAIIRIIKTV